MNYENFINTEITGDILYSIFPSGNFYKLTNNNEIHNSYFYKDGLNIDIREFDPTPDCIQGGGLYFFHESQIKKFYKYIDFDIVYMREVTFPDDVRIYVEHGKMKADKIILKKREQFYMDFFMTEKECLTIIKFYPSALKYVKEQTEELCLAAVKQDGTNLKYVKNQTEQICLEAVKQDGYALQYVKEQTEELCLTAVKRYGMTLKYVKEQTEELCLIAVKQDGWALQFVKEQTEEMCLIAVKQNGWILQHVKKQTEAICLEAVKQNINSKKHVEIMTPKLYSRIKCKEIYNIATHSAVFVAFFSTIAGMAIVATKIGIEF